MLAVPGIVARLLEFLRVDAAGLGRELLESAVVVAVAWMLSRLLRLVTRRIERAAAKNDPLRMTAAAQRGRTLAHLVQSTGVAVLVIAAGLFILSRFVNIAPLLAGVGIVTIAVSFGAQGLVKDFIAGFFILLEDQFRVGETIRVGGVEGRVERMSLRTATLRDGTGPLHFIPNGSIGVVSNLSRDWARALVDVGVAYREDVDRVIALLRRLLTEFAADPAWKGVIVGQPTVAGLQRIGESSVDVRVWVDVFPGKQAEVERELRRRIKNRLDEEGIAMPFPQRVVPSAGAPSAADLPRA